MESYINDHKGSSKKLVNKKRKSWKKLLQKNVSREIRGRRPEQHKALGQRVKVIIEETKRTSDEDHGSKTG